MKKFKSTFNKSIQNDRPTESVIERYPRRNPGDCTTKEVSVKDVKYSSLRADECRRGNPLEVIPSQLSSRTARASRGTKRKPRFSQCRFTRVEQDSFGIWSAAPIARNVGQMLKQVQHDKNMCNHKITSSVRFHIKFGMTPTESVLCLVNRLSVKKYAFTMAEILLSLTIIGVVAAITLPSLTGNINERTWNTQRKALYARMSQAIALMPALNGYGTLSEETDSAGSTSIVDTAAETFVTNGLAKVMKINNICDNEHLEDCGVVSKITTLAGSQIDFPDTMGNLNSLMVGTHSTSTETISIIDTKAAAFETQNGESIAVYYNPNCVGDLQNLTWGGSTGYFGQTRVCANFIYDLNGNKGPNTVGKDIGFMTLMYPSDPKISAPIPAQSALSGTYAMSGDNNATQACTASDSEYRVPNIEELYAMFVNKNLLKNEHPSRYWSSTSVTNGSSVRKLFVNPNNGEVDDQALEYAYTIWCIKR